MSLIFYFSFYRFHGEKLQRNVNSGGGKRRRVADKQVIISTIYDNPSETDPPEPLMRSRGPHHLKYRVYRHEIEFVKGDQRWPKQFLKYGWLDPPKFLVNRGEQGGVLHKTFTGEKLPGYFYQSFFPMVKSIAKVVFRFYQSFSPVKVLCNRPKVIKLSNKPSAVGYMGSLMISRRPHHIKYCQCDWVCERESGDK